MKSVQSAFARDPAAALAYELNYLGKRGEWGKVLANNEDIRLLIQQHGTQTKGGIDTFDAGSAERYYRMTNENEVAKLLDGQALPFQKVTEEQALLRAARRNLEVDENSVLLGEYLDQMRTVDNQLTALVGKEGVEDQVRQLQRQRNQLVVLADSTIDQRFPIIDNPETAAGFVDVMLRSVSDPARVRAWQPPPDFAISETVLKKLKDERLKTMLSPTEKIADDKFVAQVARGIGDHGLPVTVREPVRDLIDSVVPYLEGINKGQLRAAGGAAGLIDEIVSAIGTPELKRALLALNKTQRKKLTSAVNKELFAPAPGTYHLLCVRCARL